MVALVLAALVLVPFLFEDRIAERVEAEIDRAVQADVSWDDVELRLIRTFPSLTLGLVDVTVVGVAPFDGDTIASVGRLSVALDFGSVIRMALGSGALLVRSIRVEEPRIQLTMGQAGAANWRALLPDADGESPAREDGAARDLAVELRAFEIIDGSIVFENAPSGLFASIAGLRHSLSGDFSRDSLVASTRTTAESATFRFAGTPYLFDVALEVESDLEVDIPRRRITFGENRFQLNDLLVRFTGEIAKPGEDMTLDLAFEAPETDFRQMLSLVPAMYAQDFASLQTAGRFSLQGRVQGSYGEDAFPSFALTANVEDGSFRYPDLPLPARAIAADLSLVNPGGDVDSTVVSLSRFHIEIGGQAIDGAVTVRTPVSDPDVDARVEGTLDLGALAQTVKMEGPGEISGSINADAAVRARMSDVDSARYERVAATGTVATRNVTLSAPDLRQPVVVEEATIRLSPERASLDSFRALLGSSDLQATGGIDNLLGFLMRDEPLRGSGTVTSRRFILDEWRSDDELSAIAVPAMLDLTLVGTFERLVLDELEMSDARGSLRIRDERLILDEFRFGALGGQIRMNGFYETSTPAEPTFEFAMDMDSVDIAGAASTFLTVRTLAPVARYARGTFSAALDVNGALTPDMTPILDALDGGGSLSTSRIEIEDFPMLERLSETLRIRELSDPTLSAIRSSIEIRDGRLFVEPFEVGLAGLTMTVDGSNGIDQTLDYSLGLAVPASLLGDAAGRVVQDLAIRAGRAGLDLGSADSVQVGVRVGGTVSDPSLDLGLGERAASVRDLAGLVAGAAVDRRVDEAQARIDAAEEEARQRAQARVDSLVADAEARAAVIRSEARSLADQIRAEGERRAEEVLAQATNPLARRAAEPVAERIRREANERADALVAEADQRADALVAEVRERAGEVPGPAGPGR